MEWKNRRSLVANWRIFKPPTKMCISPQLTQPTGCMTTKEKKVIWIWPKEYHFHQGGRIHSISGGPQNILSWKNYYLLFFPPTYSSWSMTFDGLTRRPSRALDSPRALLPELQRNKDAVRCAALGTEVPGGHRQQLTQTLIVRLLKTHFFTVILDCDKSTE